MVIFFNFLKIYFEKPLEISFLKEYNFISTVQKAFIEPLNYFQILKHEFNIGKTKKEKKNYKKILLKTIRYYNCS